jgi:acetoin utilization protein AcuB
MTACPDVVAPDTTSAAARTQMLASNIRHLPVVDNRGRLVGIVSQRDLALLESTGPTSSERHVRDAMNVPFTCGPEAQLHAVASKMSEARFGSAVIVDPAQPSQVLGIFTTVDALRAIIQLTQPYLVDPNPRPED